jgi:hypothetical protein
LKQRLHGSARRGISSKRSHTFGASTAMNVDATKLARELPRTLLVPPQASSRTKLAPSPVRKRGDAMWW